MATMTKSSKAQKFAADAKELGWKAAIQFTDGKEHVTASKGDLELHVIWDGNVYNYWDSHVLKAGQHRTLRNASEAVRIMQGEVTVKPVKEATRRKRQIKPEKVKQGAAATSSAAEVVTDDKATDDANVPPVRRKPATRLPFDLSKATDDEVITAVLGKYITWRNRMYTADERYDGARVYVGPQGKANHIRIERNRRDERCLTFAAAEDNDARTPGGGFRSVRLDAIISITNK